jgi:hypothetical protein
VNYVCSFPAVQKKDFTTFVFKTDPDKPLSLKDNVLEIAKKPSLRSIKIKLFEDRYPETWENLQEDILSKKDESTLLSSSTVLDHSLSKAKRRVSRFQIQSPPEIKFSRLNASSKTDATIWLEMYPLEQTCPEFGRSASSFLFLQTLLKFDGLIANILILYHLIGKLMRSEKNKCAKENRHKTTLRILLHLFKRRERRKNILPSFQTIGWKQNCL